MKIQTVQCPLDRINGILTSPEGTAARRFAIVTTHRRATNEEVHRAIEWLIARDDLDDVLRIIQMIGREDPRLRDILQQVYDSLWSNEGAKNRALAKQVVRRSSAVLELVLSGDQEGLRARYDSTGADTAEVA